jgi:hypothetical protein
LAGLSHFEERDEAISLDTNLIWMANGEVRTDDDEAIRKMLGWGGLDKDLLLCH